VRLDLILCVQVDQPRQGQVEVDKCTFDGTAGPCVGEPVDGPASPRPALNRFAVFLDTGDLESGYERHIGGGVALAGGVVIPAISR
jgi:hypothetical protein